MDKQNLFMQHGIIQGSEFFNQSWDNPTDQFESALSSMVSSPVTSHAAAAPPENSVLRELIGRLSSGEISPAGCTDSSCYNTPLSSPPKLNLSSMADRRGPTNFPYFSADPGFAERAARFSCFSGGSQIAAAAGNLPEFGDSRENSTVSEQIPAADVTNASSRKRKSGSAKGKTKDAIAAPSSSSANAGSENNESNTKRTKSDEQNSGKDKDSSGNESKDKNAKAAEAPKDYIHVRARRGQATDAHSLAERVRREKISERMKLLQDLVPGCNKVTGKAVMLDEIINYVQSLQRQVEFLSMKLATINPRMEFNMEALLSKDMYQYRGPMGQNMFSSDGSGSQIPYAFQSLPSIPNLHSSVLPKGSELPFPINPMTTNSGSRNLGLTLPPMDNFLENSSQVPAFFEDDLNSVVQMGFVPNQSQNFHGNVSASEMKVEI